MDIVYYERLSFRRVQRDLCEKVGKNLELGVLVEVFLGKSVVVGGLRNNGNRVREFVETKLKAEQWTLLKRRDEFAIDDLIVMHEVPIQPETELVLETRRALGVLEFATVFR